MPYRLVDGDPDVLSVRRLTLVPFLPDGRCVVAPGSPLPTGAVRDGEHWLLDTCLRIPRETVGFRVQRVHPFAVDGDHVYVWVDGDHHGGPVADGAEHSAVVRDALRSFRAQSDASYYADNLRLLEAAYLRGETPQAGSGFGGDDEQWRVRRGMIVDGVDRDGTFLDVGCANGLLMESVREWAGERGRDVEPYGVDLAPRLVELARRRLPRWADRIEVGNAIDYRPADGRRFTFVHVLLENVPRHRRADLIRRLLRDLVEPGGRLLVSQYGSSARTAASVVRELGFDVAGGSRGGGATTAWVDN